ncbi:MAG: DUF1232 domain-containing protein [Holophagales bacterium]|nr:DUF1232 domain-containing protein [Holophagales bacterium]MYG29695.1 DUF1232 domain-containing protein [Holophagales bacterium]MYI79787.1 DUF1232 domain-containing protein [Holophagales bacterium]
MASDRELTRDTVEEASEQPSAPPKTGEMELPLHARNRAAEIVQSPDKLRAMVAEAREKADSAGGATSPLSAVIEDLKTMFDLLRAVARGNYRLRKETLILIAGAVLYFVIPIDVIPDFIPVAGFIDDAAVIAWVVKTCKTEIDLFRALTAGDNDREPEPEPA